MLPYGSSLLMIRASGSPFCTTLLYRELKFEVDGWPRQCPLPFEWKTEGHRPILLPTPDPNVRILPETERSNEMWSATGTSIPGRRRRMYKCRRLCFMLNRMATVQALTMVPPGLVSPQTIKYPF